MIEGLLGLCTHLSIPLLIISLPPKAKLTEWVSDRMRYGIVYKIK